MSIIPLLSLLEETNDPGIAYFSFAADDKGEYGVINANKEGLRLYALDLLRKSVEMENRQDGHKLCFRPQEWLISDAGYDLVRAVKPEYATRQAILANTKWSNETEPSAKLQAIPGAKNYLGMALVLVVGFIIGFLTIAAVLKWFR